MINLKQIPLYRTLMLQKGVELIIVITIISITAYYAIHYYQITIYKAKIIQAVESSFMTAKTNIIYYYAHHGSFPKNNLEAKQFGIFVNKETYKNSLVKQMRILDGAIHFNFNEALHYKSLSIRPALLKDSISSPIIWGISKKNTRGDWKLQGRDQTDLKHKFIPINLNL